MVDLVRFLHPTHGYVKNDPNGALIYERWIPSPLIHTWLEAGGLGAKDCARAYELSNRLAWVAKGCPVFAGYVGKSPRQSAAIAKTIAKKKEKWCFERGRWFYAENERLWNASQRKLVESSLGVKREIVKVEWAGVPMPAWTTHKGAAMGFNPTEAEAFESELTAVAELLDIMPSALQEAKALGYAMGRECEPARLSKHDLDFAGMARESYVDKTDVARRKGYMLYVDYGVKKGFVRSAKGNQWQASLSVAGTAGAQIFEDPDLAKKFAGEMCSGSQTVKLVEVDIAICSYETIAGNKFPVDELDAAVCLRESEDLRGEIEAASLERIEIEERAVKGARKSSNRL